MWTFVINVISSVCNAIWKAALLNQLALRIVSVINFSLTQLVQDLC